MRTLRYPSPTAEKYLAVISTRDPGFKKKDLALVQAIVDDVKKNGDKAVLAYAKQFDCPRLTRKQIKVSPEEMARASSSVDKAFKSSLRRAIKQIREFHARQAPNSWMDTPRPGTFLGQMVRPVDAAGIYVPGGRGGTTPLVSSVLMGAVPAKIAGVRRMVMVTPTARDGSVAPHLLEAARMCGIKDVYKIGSAWAIAALAYGTQTIDPVDVIVGPGNIYVTLAKKIVSGHVGIDMIAGPSEIFIIADGSANPAFLAADMLSQAEHDPLASAVLATNDPAIAKATTAELKSQLAALPRREIAEASLKKFGAIFQVPDLTAAVGLSNRLAPEHLELQVAEPFAMLKDIRHAGAIFMGHYTPEPVGDYIAGPNHVLPTARTARFSSALGVETFLKRSSIIHYTREAFEREADDIMCLAKIEQLDAHAQSVKVRLSND